MRIHIKTEDAFTLRGEIFFASYSPLKEVIIINAAFGFLKEFYQDYAKFITEQGYVVVTYDYRGTGESVPYELKSLDEAFTIWGSKDFPAVVDFVRNMFPKYGIHILGHGSGGAIVGFCKLPAAVRTVINICVQDSHYAEWPDKLKFYLWFRWRKLIPFRVNLTRRIPVISKWPNAAQDSGLELRMMSPDVNPDLLEKTVSNSSQFEGRLLTISITDDPVMNQSAVERLHNRYTKARNIIRYVYPEDINAKAIGFANFFIKANKDTLWHMSLNWLLHYDLLDDSPIYRFKDEEWPIVTIEMGMQEPADPDIHEYFKCMVHYLEKGGVIFIIDLRRVHWANENFRKKTSVLINNNADLIRRGHRGSAYVINNPFIRGMVKVMHTVTFVKIIKPVQVFSTMQEAKAWAKSLLVVSEENTAKVR